MRKILLTLSMMILLSFTLLSSAQTKAPTKPQFVTLTTEDATAVIEAYRIANDRKKDYDLAMANADKVEADAAANTGVSRKEYFLSRDKDGNLGFELKPPAPAPTKK